MVAFSFQKQFAEPIIAGTKRQTIRARARAKPGDRLQLYTGMRTKACRKIGDAVCRAIYPIILTIPDHHIRIEQSPRAIQYTSILQAEAFARMDGFADWAAMAAFFAKHYPGVEVFEGVLHLWRDFTPATISDTKSRATAAAASTAAAAKRRKG